MTNLIGIEEHFVTTDIRAAAAQPMGRKTVRRTPSRTAGGRFFQPTPDPFRTSFERRVPPLTGPC
jgi:hypothetical protein